MFFAFVMIGRVENVTIHKFGNKLTMPTQNFINNKLLQNAVSEYSLHDNF